MKTENRFLSAATPVCLVASLLLSAGCECMKPSDVDHEEIDALNAKGIAWSIEEKNGNFSPVICMGATVGWSFLPGAAQVFMAHKIEDAIDEGRLQDPRAPGWAMALRAKGVPMLIFSWIPYVYDFTHPFGTAAAIVDVNRINNVALREELQRRSAGN
jgi:hypothetical protein